MRTLLHSIFGVLSFLILPRAYGYDTETHALITRQAYANSILGDHSIYANFGFDRLDQSAPFNLYWYTFPDPTAPAYYTKGIYSVTSDLTYPEAFESCNMSEFLYSNVDQSFRKLFNDTVYYIGFSYYSGTSDPILPFQNWLVRGAVREDDTGWFKSFRETLILLCGRSVT
jgi:hypothetical protein